MFRDGLPEGVRSEVGVDLVPGVSDLDAIVEFDVALNQHGVCDGVDVVARCGVSPRLRWAR